MKNLHGTYVHRGDSARRLRRIKRYSLLVAVVGTGAVAWRDRPNAEARAAVLAPKPAHLEISRLRRDLDATRGELTIANKQLVRWNSIYTMSTRYKVSADMAAMIHDAALAEGIDPDLGFRIVRAESEFNPRATSHVGAVGLLQVMPETARDFQKGVTRSQLYEPRTNLRIGFRYLRALAREYHGSMRLALLVYNRGPVAVETLRGMGMDPSNGYETGILKGYRGNGLVE